MGSVLVMRSGPANCVGDPTELSIPLRGRFRLVERFGAVKGQCGVIVVLAALGAAVLAGCGGSPSGSAAATGTPGASAGSSSSAAPDVKGPPSGAPDPNAPDVNTAGDIPDSQVFVPFTAPGGLVTVSVPQGWARSDQGTVTVFTDKFNSVRIESRPRPAAPDVASVGAQEVPQLQGSTPGFVLGDVRMVQRSAGPVVLVAYQESSAPNPVTGKSVTEAVERYSFWRSGQEVVLTLSGPQGADNVDPWRKITDSLRWQR
jgi:hypothetical protein